MDVFVAAADVGKSEKCPFIMSMIVCCRFVMHNTRVFEPAVVASGVFRIENDNGIPPTK